MIATRAAKRSAVDSRNPLQQAGILQRVLDYVGPGHWRFVAEVSRLWRELYSRVADVVMQAIRFEWKINCVPQMTTFSAVFSSPSRLRLYAQARELHCKAKRFQRAAGTYADIATLQAAHELGMQYTDSVLEGAASCNELAVMQFLRAQGAPLSCEVFSLAAARGHTAMCAYLHSERCPWDEIVCGRAARNDHASTLRWLREHGCVWNAEAIALSAAQGGSVDVMVYLQQQGIVFTAAKLTSMLRFAGTYNQLTAAKWLRQQGAEWPAQLGWCQDWPDTTLTWARAEGCTSPNWIDQ
jgi:hypothetical protein